MVKIDHRKRRPSREEGWINAGVATPNTQSRDLKGMLASSIYSF
jgi:hypothetical protein